MRKMNTVKTKEYYESTITYNDIIIRQFDRIAQNSGDVSAFINHVETLDLLMTPFKENGFDEKVKEEIAKFLEENDLRGEVAKIEVAKLKLKKLTILAQKAGFIPAKMVEGVLDAELIERIFVES